MTTAVTTPIVHVIDDDDALRDGLCNLLQSADIAAAGFASPQEFLDAWVPEACGCLLLDIRFPGGNGLDLQAELEQIGILMPVVLMTGEPDVTSSIRGLKAGAVDFLVKPFEDEQLFESVRAALERDRARYEAETEMRDLNERYASLTSREREVMTLVCKGLMNKQVAGHLNLSEITVKVHRGTMMRKMGVRTLPDLVRSASALADASR
ncbi:response regulator transcription factor [Sphingomonas glacialis]|uniref:DNA-binding response regulator n=1 Tax=Sphingomonas glacialis TaxID=658225 RepID=A0A502FRK5_9SPHN|nr:response regulator [Sphingomonas glacialis]TPG52041.1 DNA-binding response regulator [Sphingomonas glacialis]